MIRLFILATALFAALPAVPAAQAQMPGASDAPIEISAAKSLEWDRRNHRYVARNDAVAKQGAFSIASDTLTARYDGQKGATSITEISAEGNVTIDNPPYKGYGDKGVYTVAQNHAVLTGGDLRIVTATESLKARDSIEFFGAENRLVAKGQAMATRGTDTIRANALNAFFEKDAGGKLAMNKVTAEGDVVITTARETVHGDRGTYNIPAQKAVLTGKVKIFQGKNWLEGTRAEVDMKTGVSQLFAEGKTDGGRVKGVFYPKKDKPAAP